MSDPLDNPSYTQEPVGGGAESVPDPQTPEAPVPDHDIDGDDESGTDGLDDALGEEVQER